VARFEPKKVAPIDRNHWHKSNRYIQLSAVAFLESSYA